MLIASGFVFILRLLPQVSPGAIDVAHLRRLGLQGVLVWRVNMSFELSRKLKPPFNTMFGLSF